MIECAQSDDKRTEGVNPPPKGDPPDLVTTQENQDLPNFESVVTTDLGEGQGSSSSSMLIGISSTTMSKDNEKDPISLNSASPQVSLSNNVSEPCTLGSDIEQNTDNDDELITGRAYYAYDDKDLKDTVDPKDLAEIKNLETMQILCKATGHVIRGVLKFSPPPPQDPKTMDTTGKSKYQLWVARMNYSDYLFDKLIESEYGIPRKVEPIIIPIIRELEEKKTEETKTSAQREEEIWGPYRKQTRVQKSPPIEIYDDESDIESESETEWDEEMDSDSVEIIEVPIPLVVIDSDTDDEEVTLINEKKSGIQTEQEGCTNSLSSTESVTISTIIDNSKSSELDGSGRADEPSNHEKSDPCVPISEADSINQTGQTCGDKEKTNADAQAGPLTSNSESITINNLKRSKSNKPQAPVFPKNAATNKNNNYLKSIGIVQVEQSTNSGYATRQTTLKVNQGAGQLVMKPNSATIPKAKFYRKKAPKSNKIKSAIQISKTDSTVRTLRSHRAGLEDVVFSAAKVTPIDTPNGRKRHLPEQDMTPRRSVRIRSKVRNQ